MKKIFYVLLSVSITFAACKKEDDEAAIVGVWTPTSVDIYSSYTMSAAGINILSFDTTFTATPAELEMQGDIEFTNSGTIITTDEDGNLETENYTTSGNTITINSSDGTTDNVIYSITEPNLSLTISNNETSTEVIEGEEVTTTESTDMTIHATRKQN